jgi:hypothetical protein
MASAEIATINTLPSTRTGTTHNSSAYSGEI